jgi:hypothetical protein
VLVLITAGWNLVRLWSSLVLGGMLQEYAPNPGPVYTSITGAAFAGLAFVVLYGFWRRAEWAPAALLSGTLAYAAWSWMDRLVFQASPFSGWQFSLVVTAVLLVFVTAVALDPRNQHYFGREAHEREDEERAAS